MLHSFPTVRLKGEVCQDKIWHGTESHIVEWKIWCPATVRHAKQALTMQNNTSVQLKDKALGSVIVKRFCSLR